MKPRWVVVVVGVVGCSHAEGVETFERRPDRRSDAGSSQIGAPVPALATFVTDEVAGARLRPVFEKLESADGAQLLRHQGWFDVELDTACALADAGDGKLRCAPLEGVPADPAKLVTLVARDTGSSAKGRLRLVHTTWTGTDDSKAITTRVHDTERDEICNRGRADDGVDRCLPAGAPLAELDLAGTTCESPTLSVPKSALATGYVARTDPDACLATQLFPPLAGQPCPDRGDDFLYFADRLPASIPPSAFAEVAAVTRDAEPGYYGASGSRLVLRRTGETADGFERLDPPELFDVTTGERCVVALLDDGQIHCAGPWDYLAFGDDTYSDAQCTNPVAGVRRRPCAPGKALLAAWPRSAGAEAALLERGVPLAPGPVWSLDARGTCNVAPWIESSVYDVFRRADLVPAPASRFPVLTRSLVK